MHSTTFILGVLSESAYKNPLLKIGSVAHRAFTGRNHAAISTNKINAVGWFER